MAEQQGRGGDKAIPAGLGLAADAAAVSVLLIDGGRGLVWALAVVGIAVGVIVLIRRWGQPINLVVYLAAAATLLGAGVLGFAIGQARLTDATASGQTPDNASTAPDTESASTARVTPTTTVATPKSSNGPSATAPAVPTTSRILTSGSDSLAEVGGPVDLDATDKYDIDITDWSIDGLDGTQFSPGLPTGVDPALAECTAIPTPQWRSSLALDEFRDGGTFCVRTGSGHYGFLAIRSAELRGGELAWAHSRWTFWE